MIFSLFDFLCIRLSYKNSSYSRDTGKTFNETFGDKGSYGEYLTYHRLRKYEKNGGKFLFNAYILRKDGDTTEIDLMLICSEGIFVFESKNYSGWIFGSENQRYWTQSFSDGKGGSQKYKFYNPIWQNDTHIKALQWVLGDTRVNIYSYIVFGDECRLMDIRQNTDNYYVVQRKELLSSVKANAEAYGSLLSDEMIDWYYRELYPYTQVSEEQKMEHARKIHERYHM